MDVFVMILCVLDCLVKDKLRVELLWYFVSCGGLLYYGVGRLIISFMIGGGG